jgi:hypothetical protein
MSRHQSLLADSEMVLLFPFPPQAGIQCRIRGKVEEKSYHGWNRIPAMSASPAVRNRKKQGFSGSGLDGHFRADIPSIRPPVR